jgi:hypothetical protein
MRQTGLSLARRRYSIDRRCAPGPAKFQSRLTTNPPTLAVVREGIKAVSSMDIEFVGCLAGKFRGVSWEFRGQGVSWTGSFVDREFRGRNFPQMSFARRLELTQDQASSLRMLVSGLARIRGNSVRPRKGSIRGVVLIHLGVYFACPASPTRFGAGQRSNARMACLKCSSIAPMSNICAPNKVFRTA